MPDKYVYICEPDHIDVAVIKSYLTENYHITEGSIDFINRQLAPFDVLIIRSETQVDKTIKHKFPHLKCVIRIGTGLDNVDVEYCKKAGIEVYNAAGANAAAVAEYILTMSLYVLRNIHKLSIDDVMDWNRFKFRGASLHERHIGLIGFGHIGGLLYRSLESMGCKKVTVYDPYIDAAAMAGGIKVATTIQDVFKSCNFISIQVPLTSSTKHLIGTAELGSLPEEALVINVSHGGVVNETALLGELSHRSGLIYVADTVSSEPNPDHEFAHHPNVILTPHIASLTLSAEQAMVEQAMANFLAHNQA